MSSHVDILQKQIKTIERNMTYLLNMSTLSIKPVKENPFKNIGRELSGVYVPPPKNEYSWDQLSERGQILQAEIQNDFNKLYQELALLVPVPTLKRIKPILSAISNWIWIRKGKTAPTSKTQAIENFKRDLQRLTDFIANEIKSENDFQLIIVPDTNAFTNFHEPKMYEAISNGENFLFILTPTLTKELDELNYKNIDKGFKDKVRKSIKRIKGWRNQGKLTEGIIVSGYSVKVIPTEPSFDHLPSWIDPNNLDDRFIGSVIELQRQYPSSEIIVVTNDINMQNKLEFADLSFTDTSNF